MLSGMPLIPDYIANSDVAVKLKVISAVILL